MLAKGKAAILGSPVDHSLSPILHESAYKFLKIDWTYDRFNLEPKALNDFLATHGDYRGFSVTMPLKDSAFAIAQTHDDYSLQTKACNTLLKDSGDSWIGFNTDVAGFIAILSPVINDVDSVCVIGSGATARSAIAALCQFGLRNISIAARRHSAIDELATFFPEVSFRLQDMSAPEAEMIISTVPAGASDFVKLDQRVKVFFDVIYAPWPTKLASSALTLNCQVFSGLHLLAAQAVEQVVLMTECGREQAPQLFEIMYQSGLVQQIKRSN